MSFTLLAPPIQRSKELANAGRALFGRRLRASLARS
jgi:hypothetical protein